VYVHLLDGDLGGPLESANKVQTCPTPLDDIGVVLAEAETAG
jgi:hypothetical protein